jgi:enoyl-CoA hydratase
VSSLVSYERDGDAAVITMDDGKVNALSPAMQQSINEALDRAEQDEAGAVVLAGNAKVFSGGFDLGTLTSGDVPAALGMLTGGFELAVRVLEFPRPVIMAATGHAIAMGSFLMLTGDHRIGAVGKRFQANEVAIGMTLPIAAVEIMRMRLTPAAFQRGISMAATFVGDDAVAAGWIDEVVEPGAVLARAKEVAQEATQLHAKPHLVSKLRARSDALKAIRAGIVLMPSEFTLR